MTTAAEKREADIATREQGANALRLATDRVKNITAQLDEQKALVTKLTKRQIVYEERAPTPLELPDVVPD